MAIPEQRLTITVAVKLVRPLARDLTRQELYRISLEPHTHTHTHTHTVEKCRIVYGIVTVKLTTGFIFSLDSEFKTVLNIDEPNKWSQTVRPRQSQHITIPSKVAHNGTIVRLAVAQGARFPL